MHSTIERGVILEYCLKTDNLFQETRRYCCGTIPIVLATFISYDMANIYVMIMTGQKERMIIHHGSV